MVAASKQVNSFLTIIRNIKRTACFLKMERGYLLVDQVIFHQQDMRCLNLVVRNCSLRLVFGYFLIAMLERFQKPVPQQWMSQQSFYLIAEVSRFTIHVTDKTQCPVLAVQLFDYFIQLSQRRLGIFTDDNNLLMPNPSSRHCRRLCHSSIDIYPEEG